MNPRSFITKRISRVLRMFAGGAVLLVGLRFALWLAVHFVALPEGLSRPGPESIEIVDRNGKPLREVAQAVPSAKGPGSVYDVWKQTREKEDQEKKERAPNADVTGSQERAPNARR